MLQLKTIVFYFVVTAVIKEDKIVRANDIQKFDNVVKSPNDRRSYRGLILGNGMKVMLVSDPFTSKSAASMVLEVGALYDTRDVPGLVNLLGYVLLKGSKKYPQPDEFEKFLDEHGGSKRYLQTTDVHQQNFSFQVDFDSLAPALDRFAQFFLEPLLGNIAPEDFMDAVFELETEFQYLKTVDDLRVAEVEKLTCKPNHPFNHFFVGNMNMFHQHSPSVVLDKIVKFHSLWYSSNIMNLAVLGRESLDELEAMVVPLFQNVVNKNAKKIVYPFKYHPWGPDQLRRKIYVVPMHDQCTLRLNFSTSDVSGKYKTAPSGYVSYLLEYQGPGSLVSTLKRKNLCNSIEAKYLAISGIGIFTINCELTQNGLRNVDSVIKLIFQYLSMLVEEGVQEWIFHETNSFNQMHMYEYRSTEEALDYVQFLTMSMKYYPLETVLFSFTRETEWDPLVINQFLCDLTSDNVNVTIVSKTFKKIAKQVEKHYGSNYRIEKIPDKLIEYWDKIETTSELNLPKRNDLMPKNFNLYPIDKNASNKPHVIRETPSLEIWFLQDRVFNVPQTVVQLEFVRPVHRIGPVFRCMWFVYGLYLKLFLRKDNLFYAEYAGFEWDVKATDWSIFVQVSGYSDTISLFLGALLSMITDLRYLMDRENFKSMKRTYLNFLKTLDESGMTSQVSWFANLLANEHFWPREALLREMMSIKIEDMQKFASKLFSRGFIRVFIHGNCNKQKALEIVTVVERRFRFTKGLIPQEMMRSRMVPIGENGIHYIYQKLTRKRMNYLYYVFFGFRAKPTSVNSVINLFLVFLFKSWCGKLLQKNDYITNSLCDDWSRYSHASLGLVVMAESKRAPHHVDFVIEESLHTMAKMIEEMPGTQLDYYKEKLVEQYAFKTSNLKLISNKYWYEIFYQFHDFDRIGSEPEILKSVMKADLLDFLKANLDKSCNRGKLVVQVFPGWVPLAEAEISVPPEAIKINDATAFKNHSTLLPTAAEL